MEANIDDDKISNNDRLERNDESSGECCHDSTQRTLRCLSESSLSPSVERLLPPALGLHLLCHCPRLECQPTCMCGVLGEDTVIACY